MEQSNEDIESGLINLSIYKANSEVVYKKISNLEEYKKLNQSAEQVDPDFIDVKRPFGTL